MIFNSTEFFFFFAAVYAVYRTLNFKNQNYLLLFASYYFYASWDWRFLSLIWISTAVDVYCAGRISASADRATRKTYLTLSIAANLAILGFFKYFNFFAENLAALAARAGSWTFPPFTSSCPWASPSIPFKP